MAILDNFLEQDMIKEHLLMYQKVTEISAFCMDETGEVCYIAGEGSSFCSKFMELTGDHCPCNQAHLYASKQAEKIGEAYIFFCPGGLVHWAAPFVFNGIFKGALIGGPVQMSQWDNYGLDEIMKTHRIEISNRGVLQAYLRLVPVVDPEKVRYLAQMLDMIAKDIMKEESRVLLERKKIYQEQAVINEEIQEIKGKTDHISRYYPVELERELENRVKRGDKTGAKTILNELLGYVLFQHGNNFEMTKARVLELIVVLSRAAVEGGGKLEMIFGLNYKYLQEISVFDNVEALCEWIIMVLERFTDTVFGFENSDNAAIIKKAIVFMNENYMKNITLESTAEQVYLSPAYFSRLFKKETGKNYAEYFNQVRVEESKKYLIDFKYTLSDIANIVGFTDQSYFTKVFKKIEKVSPGQYRKVHGM